MQTSGRPNRDAVLEALDIYHRAVGPFVVRVFGDGSRPAIEAIASALPDWRRWRFRDDIDRGESPADALDIEDFPHLIDRRWNEFRSHLNGNREIIAEMRVINRVRMRVNNLGDDDLGAQQTATDLTITANILRDISDAEAADRVTTLRDRRNPSTAQPVTGPPESEVARSSTAPGGAGPAATDQAEAGPGTTTVGEGTAQPGARPASASGTGTGQGSRILERAKGERGFAVRVGAALGIESLMVNFWEPILQVAIGAIAAPLGTVAIVQVIRQVAGIPASVAMVAITGVMSGLIIVVMVAFVFRRTRRETLTVAVGAVVLVIAQTSFVAWDRGNDGGATTDTGPTRRWYSASKRQTALPDSDSGGHGDSDSDGDSGGDSDTARRRQPTPTPTPTPTATAAVAASPRSLALPPRSPCPSCGSSPIRTRAPGSGSRGAMTARQRWVDQASRSPVRTVRPQGRAQSGEKARRSSRGA